MFKQIVFLLFAISCVSANLDFTDCGSTADVRALRIRGCTTTPCLFRRGDTYLIELEAYARSSTIGLTLILQGIVPFLPPIEVFRADACDILVQGSCPITNGEFIIAQFNFTVGNLLPAINLPVRFTARDDFNQTPICGQIPVQITG